jgi:hypothetical protein
VDYDVEKGYNAARLVALHLLTSMSQATGVVVFRRTRVKNRETK